MPRKVHYEKGDKKFLSVRNDEYGTISWNVDVTEFYSGDYVPGKVNTDASVRLTDCYQIITLDFCSRKEETQNERIEKLDNLIEALQDFRTNLIEANNICHNHNESLTDDDIKKKDESRRRNIARIIDDDDD